MIQALTLNLNVMCALLLVEIGDRRRRSVHIDIAEGGGFLVPDLLTAITLHKGWDLSFPQNKVLWQKCPVDLRALLVWQFKDAVLEDELPLSTLGRVKSLRFQAIRATAKVKGDVNALSCSSSHGIKGTEAISVLDIVRAL
jgi:hypothetical protein